MVDVNVKGVVFGCHAALPHLRRTPGSVVVNVSSASALYGQPGLAVYSATKSAVCALTEALELEWRPHGVRVVDVLPLFVRTAMGEQVQRAAGHAVRSGCGSARTTSPRAVLAAARDAGSSASGGRTGRSGCRPGRCGRGRDAGRRRPARWSRCSPAPAAVGPRR